MATHNVNTRRLLCPMPVIRTQNAIADLAAGDKVHVFGTDPGMLQDIPAWCRLNGHQVLEIKEHEDDIEIIIKVGDDA